MKIMAYNCQGIGQSLTGRELKFQIKNANPTFIFLTETKCKSEEVKKKIRINNDWNSCCMGSNELSRGIALLWRKNQTCNIKEICHRYIIIETNLGTRNIKWTCMLIYGEPKKKK